MHYSCLDPAPEMRPKVWDCDDCLVARGRQPNNNHRRRTAAATARRSAVARYSMSEMDMKPILRL